MSSVALASRVLAASQASVCVAARSMRTSTRIPALRSVTVGTGGVSACRGQTQTRAFRSTVSVRSAPAVAGEKEILRKTGLYDFHVERGAKMVPFAGYEMPLSYGSVGAGERSLFFSVRI
jgi:hypothetical protein